MSIKRKDDAYLPPYKDDQGKVYKIKRTVVYVSSRDNLLGTEDWIPSQTTYSLDDGTVANTDDGEDSFTLETRPPKVVERVTPRV